MSRPHPFRGVKGIWTFGNAQHRFEQPVVSAVTLRMPTRVLLFTKSRLFAFLGRFSGFGRVSRLD